MNNVKVLDNGTGEILMGKSWSLTPDEGEIFKVDGKMYRVISMLMDYDQGVDEYKDGFIAPMSILRVNQMDESYR